jgi:hypothetical protein
MSLTVQRTWYGSFDRNIIRGALILIVVLNYNDIIRDVRPVQN